MSQQEGAAPRWSVFLSHSGAEKRCFVDCLNLFLRFEGIPTFMDERSLQPGKHAWFAIETALAEAPVVVFVLSRTFVCTEAPMKELRLALDRHKKAPHSVSIIPGFLGLSFDQIKDKDLYSSMQWGKGGLPSKPDDTTLSEWQGLLKQLREFTGVRRDQTSGFEATLAHGLVDAVVSALKEVNLLPAHFTRRLQHAELPPKNIYRSTRIPLVGRDTELGEVLSSLHKHGAAVLWAGPGEGKSALALEAACREWEAGRCLGGCLSVDMKGVGSSGNVREFLAAQLVPYLARSQGRLVTARAMVWSTIDIWLEQQGDRRVLLLFENAEDAVRHDNATRQEFEDLLEELQRRGVLLLVTSRTALTRSLGDTCHLAALQPAAAAQILTALSPKTLWQEGAAETLAAACGLNALAIILLGSLIACGRCTPKEALEDFEEAGLTGIWEEGGKRGELAARNVSDHWLRGYLHPEELEGVARLSLFGSSFTDTGAFYVGIASSAKSAGRMLRSLRSLSVVSMDREETDDTATDSGPQYSMHPLIREIARNVLQTAQASVLQSARQGFVTYMFKRGWELSDMVESSASLPAGLRLLSSQAPNFRELAAVLGQADALAEKPDWTAESCDSLANTLSDWGQLAEAEALHRRALQFREEVLGPNNAVTALSRNNLAVVLALRGQYAEAGSLMQRSLAVLERTYGFEERHVLWGNLGCLLQIQGRYAEAADLHSRALAHVEAHEGCNSPSAAKCCSNLAHALEWQGQVKQAEALHRQALGAWQASSEKNSFRAADSYGNLANLLGSLGRLQEAEVLHRQALQIKDQTMGSESVDAARARNNLANVLRQQGKSEQAEELHRQALKVMREKMGENHVDTAASLSNLAVTLLDQGRVVEAEKLQGRALRILDKALGPEHAATSTPCLNLAIMKHKLGQLAEAERLFIRALNIRERALGPSHPDTSLCRRHLENLLRDQGDFEGVEAKNPGQPGCEGALLATGCMDVASGSQLQIVVGHSMYMKGIFRWTFGARDVLGQGALAASAWRSTQRPARVEAGPHGRAASLRRGGVIRALRTQPHPRTQSNPVHFSAFRYIM